MFNNFYWKTFLRFCTLSLVLLLTCAALFFAFFYEKSNTNQDRPMFTSYASAAVSIYEYGGPRALMNWLHELEQQSNVHMYILNSKGNDVLGRTIPESIHVAIQERNSLKESIPRHFIGGTKRKNPDHFVFTQFISSKGHPYFIVTDLPPIKSHKSYRRDSVQVMGLKLLTVIIIGGLVCVCLIWYLTRPVSKLRKATLEWSSGNLAARVGEDFGNRQDDITALGRDLDLMAERLQTLMDNQQRLLTDVSHELRTPLARLQIALGLARQRAGEIVRVELDRIELEAERLNEMIGQILSLVRLGSATQADNKEETNIIELLETIISNAEFENKDTEKSVIMTAPAKDLKISANPQLIYSALENIIRNAFRYTPSHTTIDIALTYPTSRLLEITIRDHGPGVPSEKIDKIFEPFFRVAEARERDSGGYGLGLAIAKRAIEVHNGFISANNAPDGGLIITIQLPFR
jgi:two-component system sensor histidine kinase CpxA